MQTRHLAIMLTDIKGFTSRTSHQSRTEMMDLLKRHRDLVLPEIEKSHGKVVKTIGDAFLVTFDSPTDAVLCGVAIQDVLKAHNSDKEHENKIEIRIAINSGEVTLSDDNDIFGDAVNITSRLESIAEAGEVFFTEAVYLAMNKKEVPSSEIGYRQFKGVPEKIKVYRVLRETPVGEQPLEALEQAPAAGAAAPAPTAETTVKAGFWRRIISLGIDVIILVIAVNMLGLNSREPNARFKQNDKQILQDVKVASVNISPKGLQVTGHNGETVSINKKGVKVTDKNHPSGTLVIPEKKATGKNRVPVKMLPWIFYCGLFMWRFTATPGMRILKIKAVDFSSGGPISADKSFLRAFFSLVSLGVLLLGYAWAIWEKDGRTWHDLIAGTKIIKI